MNYGNLFGSIPQTRGYKFRVWAPSINDATVKSVKLVLYNYNGLQKSAINMNEVSSGIWEYYVNDVYPGQRYNFEIDGTGEKLDPWAQQVTNSAGESIIPDRNYEWQCNNFKTPKLHELVIYQLHVRTFPDNNHGLSNQLTDVAEELWYLRDLGINAIQLLPTAEFAGEKSWGYNSSCIFAIEESYGGPKALKKLVDSAHSHGIAVFLDVVYNHLQPDSSKGLYQFTPWYKTIPYPWGNVNSGGIYFYNDDRAHTAFGEVNRPDYGRDEVREFLMHNALMWMHEYRIDGLRFDSTGNIRNVEDKPDERPNKDLPDGWRLMRKINIEKDTTQPWKITIAEDLKNNEWITKKASGEWGGGAGFNTQWEENFFNGVCNALTEPFDQNRDMSSIVHALYHRYNGDAFQRIIFTENHDKVADKSDRPGRLPDRIEPGNVNKGWYAKKRSTLGAGLLMTAPGVPMLHQGQELLEWRRFGENAERNGVDWNRFCTDICNTCTHRCIPTGDFCGIYMLYRDLIRLRRNWFNNTRGLKGQNINVFHCNPNDKFIAFHRWDNGGYGDDVIIVANFANKSYNNYTIGFPNVGKWFVRFNSDSNAYCSDFSNTLSYDTEAFNGPKDGMHYWGNIGIGPYSLIILSQ